MVTRQQLDQLRQQGDDQDYQMVDGDPNNPSPSDSFIPRAPESSPNLLDNLRDQAGVVPAVPGDQSVPAMPQPKPKADLGNFIQQFLAKQNQPYQDDTVAQQINKAQNGALFTSGPSLLGRFATRPKIDDLLAKQNDVADEDEGDDSDEEARQPSGKTVISSNVPEVKDAVAAAETAPTDDKKKELYNSLKDLADAQKRVQQNLASNAIFRGSLQFGAALARQNPDFSGMADLDKLAHLPLDQYQQKQNALLNDQKIQEGIDQLNNQEAEEDPNSSVSKAVRDTLGKMGLPVAANTTAKQLRDQGVNIGSLLGIQEQSKARMVQAQLLGAYRQQMMGQKQDLQDQRIHNQVMRQIDSNPNVKQRVTQIQNLDNALAMLEAFPEGATPQQIADAQQLVVRNMGITGQSGVGERAERYIHTLGMKGAGLLQFITGDPVKLSANSNLMNYIKQQAHTERANANQQLLNSINMVSAGHGSLYKRNPDLLMDLKDKLGNYQSTMGTPVNVSAATAGKPQTVIQNGHTYTLNPSSGQYE